MRYIIIITSLLILLACNKSPENKAQTTVKSYLDTVLNNPKTYESMSWSKVDSAYEDGIKNPLYRQYLDSSIQILNAPIESSMEYVMKSREYRHKADSISQTTWKEKWLGYQVTHKFRASNKMGAVTIFQERFILSPGLDTVYRSENISDGTN
jgi:hypothetical protein